MRATLALALLLFSSSPVRGADAPISIDVVEHQFPNGLTLLILEHHQAPIVSCSIVYRAGSVNEEPGHTGISHLLEHMMFKGTKTIGTKSYAREEPLLNKINALHEQLEEPDRGEAFENSREAEAIRAALSRTQQELDALTIKNELWEIYERNGATGINAGTSRDWTTYYCSLPANRLELWMWMESDRMRDAVFRDFHKEKAVVLEERRLSIDDSPDGFLLTRLFAGAFIAHPYRWPVIGWESDIERISLGMITAYYRRYYAPHNAIAVIVGAIRPEEVIAMAERYFSRIPAQPPPPPVVTREPVQRGRREIHLEFDASPRLALAYHRPAVGTRDDIVLDMLQEILSGGRTSRLYRNLVVKKRVAVSVHADSQSMRFPSLFTIYAIPRAPHTTAELEGAIREELDALGRELVSDWEIEKARKQIESDFVRGLEATQGLAFQIGISEAIYRWDYINDYIPEIRRVTAEDILRAVNSYLKEDNCTVASL